MTIPTTTDVQLQQIIDACERKDTDRAVSLTQEFSRVVYDNPDPDDSPSPYNPDISKVLGSIARNTELPIEVRNDYLRGTLYGTYTHNVHTVRHAENFESIIPAVLNAMVDDESSFTSIDEVLRGCVYLLIHHGARGFHEDVQFADQCRRDAAALRAANLVDTALEQRPDSELNQESRDYLTGIQSRVRKDLVRDFAHASSAIHFLLDPADTTVTVSHSLGDLAEVARQTFGTQSKSAAFGLEGPDL